MATVLVVALAVTGGCAASVTTPNPVLSLFAERLRLLRGRLGSNQHDLAQRIGVAQTTVSSWEQAKASPSVPELIALCNLFRVAADYLLGRADTEVGLAPDQWIVDEAKVDELRSTPPNKRKKTHYATKVPRRARVCEFDEVERLRRELEG